MASLSPKARALISSGRRALRATPADRARIEGALRARLGAGALPPDASPVPLAPRAGWSAVTKAAAAVCLVGGALVVALAPRPGTSAPRTAAEPPSADRSVEPAATSSLEQRPAPTEETKVDVSSASPPPAASALLPRRRDPLAQEVSLLTRATGALRAGRAQDALRALDAHQRRFPAGVLAEERRAAKVQALCMLGRIREGRAELSQLGANSPAAARGEQVCADSAKPTAR